MKKIGGEGMSGIRPVEVQGVMQRTQDISQIKQNQDMKPQVDQSHYQTQVQKHVESQSKQVNHSDNANKKEEKYDAKEKGNGAFYGNPQQQRRKKEEEEEDEGIVVLKQLNRGSFDAKI